MITLLVDCTDNPAEIHPQMPEHQAAMIRRCPFLGPSVERGLTAWSAYSADMEDHRELLNVVIRRAEALRRTRRTDGPLACHNIAIVGPQTAAEAQRLMDWPSWLARNLYAPVQLVVDRFWIGLGRHPDRSPIEPPPVSFFMIRSRIGRRDRLIASDRILPELLQQAGRGDDGRDVFVHTLGHPCDNPATAWPQLVAAFPVSTTG